MFEECGRLMALCGNRNAAELAPVRARGSIHAASQGSGRASKSHGQAHSNMRPPDFKDMA